MPQPRSLCPLLRKAADAGSTSVAQADILWMACVMGIGSNTPPDLPLRMTVEVVQDDPSEVHHELDPT